MTETTNISRDLLLQSIKCHRCVACFTQERNLKPLRDTSVLARLCPEIDEFNSNDNMVCWECASTIKNVMKFREKILNAQALWKRAVEGEQMDPKGISCLDTTNVLFISIVPFVNLMAQSAQDNPNENSLWKTEFSFDEPFSKLEIEVPKEIKDEPVYDEQDGTSYQGELEVPEEITVSEIKIDMECNTDFENKKKPPKKATKRKASVEKPKDSIKTEKKAEKRKSKPKKNPKDTTNLPVLDDIVIRKECLKETFSDEIVFLTFEDRNICSINSMTETQMLEYREAKRKEKIFNNTELRCESCITRFYTRRSYFEHQAKHDEVSGKLVCAICAQRFNEETLLEKHRTSHYKMYKCAQCSYSRVPLELVLRHFQRNHLGAKRQCTDCPMLFRSSYAYERHRKVTHKRTEECSFCSNKFVDVYTLERHINRRHSGQLLECPVCKKYLRGPRNHRLHMKRMHEQVKETVTYCVECKTQFKNEQSLRSHYRVSSKHNQRENMKYQCPECGKKFYQSAALRRHREGSHLKLQAYKCEECGEAFNTKNRMYRHIKIKHKGGETRNHMCDYCGKAFSSWTFLKEHINTHTGERPYVCEDCGSTFGSSGALFWHRKCVHKIPTLKQKRLAEEIEREEAEARLREEAEARLRQEAEGRPRQEAEGTA